MTPSPPPLPFSLNPSPCAGSLTQVEDAVAGPVPAPAFQLLVLCVLQTPVMEDHPDDALGAQALQHTVSPQTELLSPVTPSRDPLSTKTSMLDGE